MITTRCLFLVNGAARILYKPKLGRSVRHLATITSDNTSPIPRARLHHPSAVTLPHPLDDTILRHLSSFHRNAQGPYNKRLASFKDLLPQYDTRAGRVLGAVLPNIPLPRKTRLGSETWEEETSRGIVLVAHVIQDGDAHDLEVSSGFCVQPTNCPPCVVTCAHTLEMIRRSPLLGSPTSISATLLIPSHGADNCEPMVVSEVLSCLPRSDLIIYSIDHHRLQPHSRSLDLLQPLPVSMYPPPAETPITTRFYRISTDPYDSSMPFWTWQSGTIKGYRDWVGAEAEPGSYDTLAHLLFLPIPTPGSSGAPLIDSDTGAIIGVVTGSRMYNRVEGLRGWAAPAETIFSMFSLPGMPAASEGATLNA